MIYVVSGYMRSGTSMMMAALEAGGLKVVKSAKRDQLNERASDANFRPNPISLYEPCMEDWSPTWPRQYDGMAIKVVAPFVRRMAVHYAGYRVVFMRRDTEEIRQSLEGAFNIRHESKRIETITWEAYRHFANRRDVELQSLKYVDVVADPRGAIASLGWPIDVERAAAVVDPGLYRFQLDRLHVGI